MKIDAGQPRLVGKENMKTVVDQQPLVGSWREFDPSVELPQWLDEYKWHRDDSQWCQTGRDATPADVAYPFYPPVWRTRRPKQPAEPAKPPASYGSADRVPEADRKMIFHVCQKLAVVLGLNIQEQAWLESLGATFPKAEQPDPPIKEGP
jgi:hypothetical protein